MLKYHHHFVPYYSEPLMLFFQIFLALLLRRQPEEVGNNKLEQLEAVFLLICDQESCVRLQCGPGNVSAKKHSLRSKRFQSSYCAKIITRLACENIRFSSLFVAEDVSRGGTSATQRQKFHTDDVISMEFLSLSRRRSSARNVPSDEERGETDVFAGYCPSFLFFLLSS